MKRPAPPHIALALTALSVLAYVSFMLSRVGPHASPAPSAKQLAPAPELKHVVPTSRPLPRAPAPAPSTAASHFDEPALMTELRELRVRAPDQALARARQANATHPQSPGAAERSWIIVRSLEDLQRFHEARDVALGMRDLYPGTSWTNDVERHVLVHPLDYPSREAQQAALETMTSP